MDKKLNKFCGSLKGKRIGVLYGGKSAEREISLRSGKAVIKVLARLELTPVPIDPADDPVYNLKRGRIDFAFIALHGPMGEDGAMQGLLEIMGIPYTGSGVLASALAMNKALAKKVFTASNIPTPAWVELTGNCRTNGFSKLTTGGFGPPCVVKPAGQGSAIGVSVVRKQEQYKQALAAAFKYDTNVLVEQYVSGTEITVGVLGEKTLPPIEIVPKHSYYDFYSKYSSGGSEHIIPARLSRQTLASAERLALASHKVLGCRAFSRVDMIVDSEDKACVLEVNTIPGLTETSLLPDAARHAGIAFEELVLLMMYNSWQVKL